jgi:hypothetical protein
MSDLAAHLVDRVLPRAPYRQWTLSLPWSLRPRLARDRRLLAGALAAFVGAIFRWQRATARARGVARPQPGAVTAVQRFGSALNANLHYHVTVPDGVFVDDGAGGARFVPLPPPTDDEVEAICARAARRIRRLVAGVDGDDGDRGDDDHGTGALLAEAARAPLAPAAGLVLFDEPRPRRRQQDQRYHGVFAGRARLRRAVTALVPGAAASTSAASERASAASGHHAHGATAPAPPRLRQPSRLRWSELLRRVFREDLEVCPRCSGPVQVIAAITDPDVIAAIAPRRVGQLRALCFVSGPHSRKVGSSGFRLMAR